MDGLLKAFRPPPAQPATRHQVRQQTPTKPRYLEGQNEDPLDLQYKSLKYMFQRADIAATDAFSKDAQAGGVGVAGAGGDERYRQQTKREILKKEYQRHQQELRNEFERGGWENKGDDKGDGDHGDDPDKSPVKETAPEPTTDSATDPSRDPDSFIYHYTRLSDPAKKKLDILYNRPAFETAVSNDKHRILIDWRKNKFRALCILSDVPPSIASKVSESELYFSESTELTSNFNETANGTSSALAIAPGFSFLILPPTASEHIYVSSLTHSSLYSEHLLPTDSRKRLAREALALAKRTRAMAAVQAKARATGRSVPLGPSGLPAVSAAQIAAVSTATFSKNDRSLVITTFLRKLAFEVQVDRLFKALYRQHAKKNDTETPSFTPAIAHSYNPLLTATGVSVKPLSRNEKYYIKKTGAPEIPYSHRPPSVLSKQPTVAPIVYAKNVPTTKPRLTQRAPSGKQPFHFSLYTQRPDQDHSAPGSQKQGDASLAPSLIPIRHTAGHQSLDPLRGTHASRPNDSENEPLRGGPASRANDPENEPLRGGPASRAASRQMLRSVSGHLSHPSSQPDTTVTRTTSRADEIKKQVMAQARKAVEQRLERERVLVDAEKKVRASAAAEKRGKS